MREVKIYHPAHGGPKAPRKTPRAQRQEGRRADPAPSRWSYRKERLMLTPGFRLLVKGVLPTVVILGAGMLYLNSEDRREELFGTVQGWVQEFQDRPQFMVARMEVSGASRDTESAIRSMLSGLLPLSSFDLELPMLKEQVQAMPAVAEASLQVRTGGVLYVGVVERVPQVIWRKPDGMVMLDSAGEVTGPLENRLDRPGLPMIAGLGAEKHVPEALDLLAAAEPVEDRVRGLERIGQRRWDLVLDRDQRIMLPEANAVTALEQVLALHKAQELLDRDVAAVDMRLAARPTVRLTADAAEEWRGIRGIVIETGN
ncbi:cell division protein FtsQ/DivIB [Pseudooceanicola sp. HF7]|uniref:cell division protein FtsQ/DivIB n=1 Tax=Pseudooceanicola sp. HF7 TaxID=2721560 RepID=UPI001431A118|nr:cell division protein FtsQ/DivIB [Pseudooceanicola sp. HF7]NIZ11233.1 cell division protein FtsQ [Pseudooceanicola sp. HF7]